MKKKFLISLIFLLVLTNCKKSEIIDGVEDSNPVFSVNGNIGTSLIDIKAGIDDYYMYSSFYQNTSNLYWFTGTFRKVNCNYPCANSFSITLRDYQPSTSGGASYIDSLLTHKLHYLNDSASTLSFTQFYSTFPSNSNPQSYNWDFGDGTTSTLKNPTHRYTLGGHYRVCHTITYPGCSSEVCNLVKTGAYECKLAVSYKLGLGDTVNFSASVGTILDSLTWDFGDGTKDNTNSLIKTHVYPKPGSYLVHAKYRDNGGCVDSSEIRIVTNGYTGGCGSYFTYSQISPLPSPYSIVEINWTDQNGSVYSSNSVVQSLNSYFQIMSVENYQPNERGEATKKIHAKVKCRLSNGTQLIDVDGLDVVFAVSYK